MTKTMANFCAQDSALQSKQREIVRSELPSACSECLGYYWGLIAGFSINFTCLKNRNLARQGANLRSVRWKWMDYQARVSPEDLKKYFTFPSLQKKHYALQKAEMQNLYLYAFMMLLMVSTSQPGKWGGFTPFPSAVLMFSASYSSYSL